MDHKEEHEPGENSKPVDNTVRKRPPSSPSRDIASPSKRAKHQPSNVPPSTEVRKFSPEPFPESMQLTGDSYRLMNSKPSSSGSMSSAKEKKIKTEIDDVFDDQTKEKTISCGVKTETKKGRLRKKAIMKSILDQMEFYFSDCNLSKDRYLRQIYDQTEDGFVDLTIFGNFNKLQSLHKDGVSLNLLRKALEKSTFLEVNEAGTKVRRRAPLVELDQEETDKRTVYVEYLPRHANHLWLQKIFSQCGKVCYVSLPTFRTTKQLKGFAFVEFQSPEEALEACKVFNNPPPARIDEKPGKFPKGNKTLNRLNRILPVKSEEEENEENTNEEKDEQDNLSSTIKKKKKKKPKKRRPSDSASEECSEKKETKQVAVTSQEGKKKKKKKKKKPGVSSESALISEEETSTKAGKTLIENLQVKEKNDDCMSSENPTTSSVKKDTGFEDVANADKKCKIMREEMEENTKESEESGNKKKKKRKKRKKSDLEATDQNISKDKSDRNVNDKRPGPRISSGEHQMKVDGFPSKPLLVTSLSSRKERKRLRQEDIQRKKMSRQQGKSSNDSTSEKVIKETESTTALPKPKTLKRKYESDVSEGSEMEDPAKVKRKSDGSELMSCLVKSKKQAVQKKVEFNPVPITNEFIKRKEVRRRKRVKRDSLHLRVITKKEWLTLKSEFIDKQKAHMSALKKSLRELRQQEEQNRIPEETKGQKHVDLTDVFGTKRLKPTLDMKLAHLEKLKFRPNVIVQWKCSHELPRQKIRAMFNDISGEHIDYIEAQEEAKSGYIRFKDEESAEMFAKVSRFSPSFSARILPESQQAAYWEKANRDRIAKLSRKRCERGSERIARKVFERNKATFHQKPSHIVFDEDDKKDEHDMDKNISESERESQAACEESGEKDKSLPVEPS